MDKDFDIRFSEFSDEKYLIEWLHDPDTLQWFPMEKEEEISIATKNWIGFSKFKCSLTGTIKGEPCAIGTLFLMPYRKVAHRCMLYLVVGPKWRGQGIGTSMIKNLLHLAKTRFRLDGVFIEIYEGCPIAQILEKKFHFTMYARQENFVKTAGRYKARLLYEYFF